MQVKIADLSEIEATLRLHAKYQIDGIKEEDKKDGFVTTAFTKEELTQLISQEKGLFIAKEGDEILAYVMAGSWQFWSQWAMFEFMIKELENLEYLGQKLSVDNSYQYGPICIDKSLRGSGMVEEIFDFARVEMAKHYPILVTFVNKVNSRSYEAHKRKLGLEVIQELMNNTEETNDWNANKYNKHADFVSTLGMPVVDLLNPQEGEKILDLGCGDGTLSLELEKFGAEVVAIDLSETSDLSNSIGSNTGNGRSVRCIKD